MHRRLYGAAVLLLALVGFSASEGRAQVVSQSSQGARVGWQAERAFHLTRITERAQASLKDALLRIEIGTLAPIDADATRQAVAQIEALIKADTVRTAQPAKTGPEIAALRIKLAETLNALDLAEVKFNNGMITTKAMNDAYLAVVKLLLG